MTIKIWKLILSEYVRDVHAHASEQKKCAQEGHKPRHETIASPLEDVEEDGEEWTADHETNEPSFDEICYEENRRRLVEPVALFEHECLVDGEWQGRNC